MKEVCPLCNGIQEIIKNCKRCGGDMIDQGPIVDYLDNYSPYLSNDITQLVDGVSKNECTHLFKCKECNHDKRISIQRVEI
ncbi:hypothetical protein [Senegalia massiliensis]|uniref:Uncharacterized protein n=1 Tax=Senegalia massiliensis TaxID=1720316 RepID=A0A845QXD8_9CLOT|nr:hypothetical protein [Senegalia massiliensis]NBI05812.1 hypothetical protein [Senegalia massiliensis]